MVVFHDKLILGSLVPRTPFLLGESCIFDRVQDSFLSQKNPKMLLYWVLTRLV